MVCHPLLDIDTYNIGPYGDWHTITITARIDHDENFYYNLLTGYLYLRDSSFAGFYNMLGHSSGVTNITVYRGKNNEAVRPVNMINHFWYNNYTKIQNPIVPDNSRTARDVYLTANLDLRHSISNPNIKSTLNYNGQPINSSVIQYMGKDVNGRTLYRTKEAIMYNNFDFNISKLPLYSNVYDINKWKLSSWGRNYNSPLFGTDLVKDWNGKIIPGLYIGLNVYDGSSGHSSYTLKCVYKPTADKLGITY